MNGRPVLQPTCNVPVPPLLQRRNSLFKNNNNNNKVISTPPTPTPNAKVLVTPPVSPKLQSPVVIKRANHDPNGFNSSGDKEFTPRGSSKLVAKKSKKGSGSTGGGVVPPNSLAEASSPLKYASSFIVEAPGSIAAARREQVAIMQVQRKMKIAHYGRTNSGKYQLGKVVPLDSSSAPANEEKRCSFITSNSGMAHKHASYSYMRASPIV